MTDEEQKMLLQLLLPHYASGGRIGDDPERPARPPQGPPVSPFPDVMPAQQPAPPPGMTSTTFGQNPYNSGIPLSNSFVAQTPTSNMNFNAGQYAPAMTGAANNLGILDNQLLQESQGGGPNLAQAQLKQATDRNIGQAYAMAQATPNNAGAARNAARSASEANQGAAAASAQQRMQQQLAAQTQLGQFGLGLYGTSGRLMTDAEKMQLEQAQGNQNAALNAQQINAQTSIANQQYGANVIGAGINAGAAALGAGATALGASAGKAGTGAAAGGGGGGGDNSGGDVTPATQLPDDSGAGDYGGGGDSAYAAYGGQVPVRHYDDGGVVSPGASPADTYNYTGKSYDYAGKSGVADPRANINTTPSMTPYHKFMGSGGGGQTGASKVGGAIAKGGWETVGSIAGGPLGGAAAGAVYDAFSPGGIFSFRAGGPVPGRAAVGGNSLKNDNVPAMLSPGEIVLPRSVTQDADAAEKAKSFVLAIQKRKKKAA